VKLLVLLLLSALIAIAWHVFRHGLPHDDDSIGDEIDWTNAWRDYAPTEAW